MRTWNDHNQQAPDASNIRSQLVSFLPSLPPTFKCTNNASSLSGTVTPLANAHLPPDTTKKRKVGLPTKLPSSTTMPTLPPRTGPQFQLVACQLNFLKPLTNHVQPPADTAITYAGTVARIRPPTLSCGMPLSDQCHPGCNNIMIAVQYLLAEQQGHDDVQRQCKEARKDAQHKHEDKREELRHQQEAQLCAEQQKRDDQHDQQFTQLGQLLSSLTSLVVKSNDNQATLLERQNHLKCQLLLQRQHPHSTSMFTAPQQSSMQPNIHTSKPCLSNHSLQADMECHSVQLNSICPPLND